MQTLLAIECSSHVNAVAYLADIDRPDQWLGDVSREHHVKASAWLLPAVDRVLAKAGARKTDVNIVAFGAGPGSFTGVRTACATAQALAYAWHAALISVDCLEALAEASALSNVEVLLDARMNELYVARFARSAANELIRLDASTLMPTAAFVARTGSNLLGSGAKLVATTAPTRGNTDAATVAAEDRWAYGVACVAVGKFRRQQFTDPQHAAPIYVRNNVALTEAERAANVLALARATSHV
jgi:tRNA threonylcarbamoyladenosine biosynthesis protein TsaB